MHLLVSRKIEPMVYIQSHMCKYRGIKSWIVGIEEEEEVLSQSSDERHLLRESGREKASSLRTTTVAEVKLMGDCKTFFTFFKSRMNFY